jgi:hypothetical protein
MDDVIRGMKMKYKLIPSHIWLKGQLVWSPPHMDMCDYLLHMKYDLKVIKNLKPNHNT